MLPFDVIDCAGYGYKTVWEERAYLAKIALVPITVKLCAHVAIIALGWDEDYFRQALVMLPAFFAEGWLLTHLVRLIFLGQRWPFRPSGDKELDLRTLEARARAVISGTLTFVVISFILAGLMAFLFEMKIGGSLEQAADNAAPSETANVPALYFFAIAGTAFLLWGFRFLWLYIPAALDYPLRDFLRALKSFRASLAMIAVWIIGYMPLFFIFMMLTSALLAPYGDDSVAVPAAMQFVIGGLNVVTDTLVALVTTAGIAYGIKSMMGQKG